MKVRHKATGVEFEAKKPLHPQPYYLTKGGSMIHVDDPAFELVPDEVWEDCTGRLTVAEDGSEASEPSEKVWAIQSLVQKYRLRKIDGLHYGPAFIVERRKES